MFGNTGFIHYGPHGSGPKGATVDPTTHKRYTTRTICDAFAKGATTGKAGALSIRGDTLYSYEAPIVQRGVLIPRIANVTSRRYSKTTTHHTHMASVAMQRAGWDVSYLEDL